MEGVCVVVARQNQVDFNCEEGRVGQCDAVREQRSVFANPAPPLPLQSHSLPTSLNIGPKPYPLDFHPQNSRMADTGYHNL